MKQRDLSLDLIRILACLMVVTTHSPLPSTEAHSVLLAGTSLITTPCNALFFMVSGALLLPPLLPIPPLSTRAFLGKRMGKVVAPVLVWSAVYLVMLSLREHLGAADIARKVLSIPFSAQGTGVLWFMYTLIGLYLVAPILSAWLAKADEKEERMYLGLWVITFIPCCDMSWKSTTVLPVSSTISRDVRAISCWVTGCNTMAARYVCGKPRLVILWLSGCHWLPICSI